MIELPEELARRLTAAAARSGLSAQEMGLQLLEAAIFANECAAATAARVTRHRASGTRRDIRRLGE